MGAGLYMCKHMVKDAYKHAASPTVLADAREHINEYPSAASDASNGDRAAKHFLQRVLNSTATERAPNRAAAIVLGMPSSGHSHSYVYSSVWDAVHLLTLIQNGCSSFAHTLDTTLASAKRADKNLNTETHPHEAIAGDSQDVIDATEQREGPVCQGSCSIYKTEDGTAIPVSQAEHYAYRSLDLIAMSFDEFVMTMQIVQVLHRQVMATTILNKLCSQEDLTIMSTSFCAHILSQPFTSSERTQSLTSPY